MPPARTAAADSERSRLSARAGKNWRVAPLPRWERPLWICPKCGNAFANRKNWHSCVRVPLADHFKDRPKARRLFNAFHDAVRAIGPVRLVSSKTRIAFMVRVRFAGCTVRKDSLRAGLWLPYDARAPRAIKKELIPPHYHLFYFDIREPEDIDADFRRLLSEAYRQGGQQQYLKERDGK
jgi:hypothetical protein